MLFSDFYVWRTTLTDTKTGAQKKNIVGCCAEKMEYPV